MTKTIAPKLANGKIRVSFGSRLPNEIKEGLRKIAQSEKQSMSWTVEQVIIDYFGLTIPKYKEPKK